MAEQRPDRPPRKPNRPTPPGGLRYGGLIGWMLFILLVVMVIVMFRDMRGQYAEITWTDLKGQFIADQVVKLEIQDNEATGEFKSPVAIPSVKNQLVTKFRTTLWPAGTFSEDVYSFLVLSERGSTTITVKKDSGGQFFNIFLSFIPWLIVFGIIYFMFFRQLRAGGGAGGMLGNFGRSRHKITSKEHTNVTFDDVAGVEEAKEEVMEIVEFLKNPRKFQRLGGRIPRGVLLVGEPGTGKTLLAKAIAGEADVPFFSISGSDFVEMFVGVGASRVRDLFKSAKDNSPCIIFLDEIDAVGRRRGSGFSSGGHDEREQTLNAILVEMDGFDTNDQVIVCAATNRMDVLDPALTRPGRFDRQIHVPLPDVKGRLDILKVHSRRVKLGPDVDLMRLARATPGFSGADLAAIINESALGATLANKDFIEQEDLEEARDKVRWGRARKSRVIDEKEKLATAYHEAGHAVVQSIEQDADPIHKVTIIPRGNYGGATMTLPEKDRQNYSRRWCIATMKTMFGGRIAEEMFTNDINTGAYGDIRQATNLARRMVRDWGMNERLGFVFYGEDDQKPAFFDFGSGGREYSEETAKAIDEEVKKLIDRLYEETRQLLEANKDRVDAIAKALLRYETLDTQDIERIMKGETLTRPTVGDLLEKERGRRATVIQPGPAANAPDVQPGLGGGPVPSPG